MMPPVLRSQTSTKRKATKPSRLRKTQRLQDNVSTLVHQYLSDHKPAQWSLDHLKSCIGPNKQPAKQKYYFRVALDNITRTTSPTAEENIVAKRLLYELYPRQDFAAPVATFNIGPAVGCTIVQGLNNSHTIDNSIPCQGSSAGIPAAPTELTSSSQTSQASSAPSKADYGSLDIPHFLETYPNLQTKFPLTTRKGGKTVEDLLHRYLQDNHGMQTDNLLLHAGFIDIVLKIPQLMSSREYGIINKAIISSKPDHDYSLCIKKCFTSCTAFTDFVDARDSFPCQTCKYDPQCQLSLAAVLYTVHFLSNSAVLSTEYLEGDYDVIWTNLIDNAFVSPHGRLHRKEKSSTISACKFDGLYIGGHVDPQEWLVIEVGRTAQGAKQTQDRQKLVEHCLRILNYRRWYLGTRTNLHGQALVAWLKKFPVWGILCQGPKIEIMRYCWLTRGLGVVTTFASAFPNHVSRLHGLYGMLGEIHCAARGSKMRQMRVRMGKLGEGEDGDGDGADREAEDGDEMKLGYGQLRGSKK
ncbi:hypothetical protein EV426DRAFT_719937 [Tirmania nivea]|nr:hypothetical protein EV426DRAFT_719937 [Tirmania nivea]